MWCIMDGEHGWNMLLLPGSDCPHLLGCCCFPYRFESKNRCSPKHAKQVVRFSVLWAGIVNSFQISGSAHLLFFSLSLSLPSKILFLFFSLPSSNLFYSLIFSYLLSSVSHRVSLCVRYLLHAFSGRDLWGLNRCGTFAYCSSENKRKNQSRFMMTICMLVVPKWKKFIATIKAPRSLPHFYLPNVPFLVVRHL